MVVELLSRLKTYLGCNDSTIFFTPSLRTFKKLKTMWKWLNCLVPFLSPSVKFQIFFLIETFLDDDDNKVKRLKTWIGRNCCVLKALIALLDCKNGANVRITTCSSATKCILHNLHFCRISKCYYRSKSNLYLIVI